MELGTDNAFAELGLAPDATETEVKAAWRRLASQWHPDRNASAAAIARMQRINQAFEAIRRSRGHAAPAAATGADEAPPQADAAEATEATEAEQPRPPIRRKLKLTLEEAAAGCIRVLRGRIGVVCSTCAGVGHQVLGGNCPRCRGSGAVAKRGWFGWPSASVECDACHGGGIARQPCQACDGSGKLEPLRYQVSVRIPPGVHHGDLLHVDRRRSRQGRPPADLEIRVELLKHPFFGLDDDGTVRCEVPVDGFAWIANRSIQVPTLGGLQPLPLSRDRLSYRLPGRGFPVTRRGPRGDQLITLIPLFPDGLSTDQEILLDQLIAAASGAAGQASDRLRNWQRGLRSWEKNLPGERH